MRRSWGARTEAYARGAARKNAAFAALLVERVGLRPGQRVLEGPAPLREAILALPEDEREAVRVRYVAALEAYRRDGQIRLPSEGILVTADR
jgi:hypothetical protein